MVAAKLQGYAALKAEVQKQGLAPAYLFHGEDSVGRRDALELVAAHLSREGSPATRRVFSGDEAAAAEIVQEAATGSLFGDLRLVVVGQVHRMPAAQQEALARELARMAPQGCLVLMADKVDRRQKATQKLLGTVREAVFAAPPANRLPAWIRDRAGRHGLKLDKGAPEALLEMVGSDVAALDTELAKLAAWAGDGGTLDAAAVREAASQSMPHAAEYAVFHLADAIVEGRGADALRTLDDLLAVGRPPLVLLGMIARQFRHVLTAGSLQAQGESPAAVAAHMRVYPFVAQKALRQAERVPPPQAAGALEHLLDADLRMKASQDGRQVLQELVVRLAAGAHAQNAR